ncbi:MAG TPA: DUF374 domain-containing protein [Ignavibacteria bacterium]|nr:DUF374 domain-containing protein [Ignavibacteria bacterium]
MKLKKLKQETLRFFGNYFLFISVNILCKTLKINYINKEGYDKLESTNENFVLAFWHGIMLLPWYLNRNKNFIALTSKSKDGNLLTKILKNWRYSVVRGSSTEGGDVALGIMIDYAKNKCSIAITTDGPKGPIHKMKAGAVITAKKSGLPLLLVGIGFKKKKILKSWDGFEIPRFFSRANVVYSNPIYIKKDLSYEDTSKVILQCEEELNKLQESASKF